jgi:hypothetical protein
MEVLRTSEFWVGLIAAVLGYLVSAHVLSPDVASYVKMAGVYVVSRLISKTAKAVVPGGK